MTASFTAVGLGAGDTFGVEDFATLSYAVTGTFSGTVVLEANRAGRWRIVKSFTAPDTGRLVVPDDATSYRFRCTVFVSGTIETTLTSESAAALTITGFLDIKTADPAAPVNDTAWLIRTGAGPYDVSFKVRIAGVTTEFPLGTTA